MTKLKYNGMNAVCKGKIEAERPCDICGNETLKTAVVFDVEGVHMHVGRVCASKAFRCKVSEIDKAAKTHECEEREKRLAEGRTFADRFIAYCKEIGGHDDHGLNLAAMGGFRAATKAYELSEAS